MRIPNANIIDHVSCPARDSQCRGGCRSLCCSCGCLIAYHTHGSRLESRRECDGLSSSCQRNPTTKVSLGDRLIKILVNLDMIFNESLSWQSANASDRTAACIGLKIRSNF